jgi:sulfite reductase (NADPH) flavoprotein alpha-component
MPPKAISIYFGTETGHSRAVAYAIAARAGEAGFTATVTDLVDVFASRLSEERNPSLFVVSSWDDGKPPFMSRRFFAELESSGVRAPDLRYAIIALGDRRYQRFCGAGKTLERLLENAEAKALLPRADFGREFEREAEAWMPGFFKALGEPRQG